MSYKTFRQNYDIMAKDMTHGRYIHREGGNGDLPPRSTETPLPFVLDFYKNEPPEHFHAFKKVATGVWNDLSDRDRRMALALDGLMSQTSFEVPLYETDQLPQVARREYTLRYRNTLSREGLENAQNLVKSLEAENKAADEARLAKEARIKKRKRILGRTAGYMAFVAAGVVLTVAGSNVVQEGVERQQNLTIMATEAQNLRDLGICAQDMRMELEFDLRNNASKEELRTDRTALRTALDAQLACDASPPQSHLLHYGAAHSGRPESSTVKRQEFSSFISADWPHQKAELENKIRHLAEEEYPDEYKLRIAVGDKLNTLPQK